MKDGAGAYVSTTNGVDVTPGNTITIRLIDTSASTWSISCVHTDDLSVAATVSAGLTIDPVTRTATFTAPAAGSAYIFKSIVNNGIGPDGRPRSDYSTTFGVYTLSAGGQRVISANETTEGDATFGWTKQVNDLIRNGSGGAVVAPGNFNVKDYGAVGDGVTNDLPAFEAAMAAMGSAVTGVARHQAVYVPPGDYYLADDLLITRAILLTGPAGGGSGYGAAKLIFAPYKGIRIYSWTNAPDRGDAAYAIIEQLDIVGAHNNSTADAGHAHATWLASTAYTVGTKVVAALPRTVRPENSFEYYFECVQAGTSGATEPDFGTLFNPDQSTLWAANTYYQQYNVVRAPGRFDVYFEVRGASPAGITQAFRSGATIPAAFATAVAGDVITDVGPDGTITWRCQSAQFYFLADGGAVWACRVAAGVYSQARFTIRDCSVRQFLNAGIHVQASSYYFPFSNANGFTVRNVQSHYNGGGILTRGDDCNASYVEMLDVIGWDVSDRDFGIAERSFLGNRYVACQVASVLGPAYMATGPSNTGSFIGCYCEGSTGLNDIRPAAFQVIGGTWGTGFTSTSEHTGWTFADEWKGIQSKVTAFGGRTVRGYMRPDTQSIFGFGSSDSAFYERLTHSHSIAGMWEWEWAQSADFTTYAIDGGRGGLGGGALFLPRGYFQGQTDRRLYAPDLASSKNYRLRKGQRNVGDQRQDNTFAALGYTSEVVTTAGFSGPAWTASRAYSCSLRGTLTLYAEVVTPTVANGYAYRCVQAGTSSGVEPTWPTAIAAQEYRSWQAGYAVELNDYIRPSTPNSHVYQVTDLGGLEAVGMATEPTWPTGAGATVVSDGITYTEVGADPTTTYVVDGTCIWECCGLEAVWSRSGEIGNVSQALNSNFTTTLATAVSTALTVRVKNGEKWKIEFDGTVQCSSTGGVKFAIATPGGSTVEGWLDSSTSAITTLSKQRITAGNTLTGTATHTVATTPGPDRIVATVTAGADGAITIQAASNTASQTTTIFAGATLKATRLTGV